MGDAGLVAVSVTLGGVVGGWPIAMTGGIALGLATILGLTGAGTSLGCALSRVRVIDSRTALPPRVSALFSRSVLLADIRSGRDPLRLVPAVLAPIRWNRATLAGEETRGGALALVADDGTRLVVDRPVIVGRRPVDESGNYTPLAIGDVSRSLSRSHAAFVPGEGHLLVVDVGSGNGTAIEDGGGYVPVPVGRFVPVHVGARVRMGWRLFEVVAS